MGDLVLVIDNEIMKRGVDRNAPIVIDIEDKVTVLAEEDTPENQVKVALRGMNSLIGETSNCATAYHNKTPRLEKTRKEYESYIDLLSVINGKAIDSAKTGVVYNIPRYIAKYGRPLPYFMKYASNYYANMKQLSKSQSNMNRLCKELEVWHKIINWRKPFSVLSSKIKGQEFKFCIADDVYMNSTATSKFDYTIMMDESIPFSEQKYEQIHSIYLQYCKDIKRMRDEYQNALSRKTSAGEYVDDIDWNSFYNLYRKKCWDICPDVCELANYTVKVCYELYPKRRKRFIWTVSAEGILSNLKQTEQYLPAYDPNGKYEYLGKKYRLEKIKFD